MIIRKGLIIFSILLLIGMDIPLASAEMMNLPVHLNRYIFGDYQYQGGGTSFSTPTIDKGKLYVGSVDGDVYELNPNTGVGKVVFSGKVPLNYKLVVQDGILCYGDRQYLYGWNIADHSLIWQKKVSYVSEIPALTAEGIVVVADDKLRAFAIKSGAMVWERKLDKWAVQPFAIDSKAIFVADISGSMYAVENKAGKLLWKRSKLNVKYELAVQDGIVFAAGTDGSILALNAQNGTRLWTTKIEDKINNPPIVANGQVFVWGIRSKRIYAIDINTRKDNWRFRSVTGVINSPLINNGILYYVTYEKDHQVINAVSTKTSVTLWRFSCPRAISSDLMVSGDNLYVTTVNGYLLSIDTHTGLKNWEFTAI